jgi:hypothetical protein
MDILNIPTHRDYGNMSVTMSGLTSVWTTLVLSILARKTYNTYTMRYERKYTKLLKNWKATYTVALP